MRVLAVDDDPSFLSFLEIALREAKAQHETSASAEEAIERLEGAPPGHFDLVLLDVHMPGASGMDVLTRVRESGDEIPVILVSGRDRVEERVRGLRLGADDFLVKPIDVEELLARMDAVLRRRRSLPSIEYGDITLDLARRKGYRAEQPLHLSPKEFDLLLALVRGNGEIVSRTRILQEVWDMDFDPRTNLLDVHIGRVRRKVDRHGAPFIETIRGQGYRAVRHTAGSKNAATANNEAP